MINFPSSIVLSTLQGTFNIRAANMSRDVILSRKVTFGKWLPKRDLIPRKSQRPSPGRDNSLVVHSDMSQHRRLSVHHISMWPSNGAQNCRLPSPGPNDIRCFSRAFTSLELVTVANWPGQDSLACNGHHYSTSQSGSDAHAEARPPAGVQAYQYRLQIHRTDTRVAAV